VLRAGPLVQRVLRTSGMALLQRVMGLLLAALAIQFIVGGGRHLLSESSISSTPAQTLPQSTPKEPNMNTNSHAHGTHHQHGATSPGAEVGPERSGLLSTASGVTLQPVQAHFSAGEASRFAFRLLDDAGGAIRDLDVRHQRAIHLVVVRRDFAHYQHLHPELGPDGIWSTPLVLPEAGPYRAVADFSVNGSPVTLGVDLTVPGPFEGAVGTPAATTTSVDGFAVELSSPHGREGDFRFRILKGSAPVGDLEPYLGALGHLVVLREGDLAYLHAHPLDSTDQPGTISFEAGLEPGANYRLFLEFAQSGRVHRAQFRVQR
jgi:hypothetical protein